MEDVTDLVFRDVICRAGKPHVMVTEFTNVEAVNLRVSEALMRLRYNETHRPIVAQLWGSKPESFFTASKIVVELGFDGVDINMGCPVRDIIKTGGCGALIGQNNLVSEIVCAVKEGSKLPVSVKTRIGNKKISTDDWIGFLLGLELAAITVHGRTVAEMSKVPAHWDEIGKVVRLRNDLGVHTLVIGNGDVDSIQNAKAKTQMYGVDGVMIGRGIFKNPFLFAEKDASLAEKFDLLKFHLTEWKKEHPDYKSFQTLKKFVKIYISGFEGAGAVREEMMNSRRFEDLTLLVDQFGQSLGNRSRS
jgi:tRNA-dihydrouridine synthase